MYELNRGIRFINASDFCIDGPKMFTGFVCGIAAQDYDLRAIYINSFMKVVKHSPEGLFGMFDFLREFSEKTNIELYISISSENEAPDYLKAFINHEPAVGQLTEESKAIFSARCRSCKFFC